MLLPEIARLYCVTIDDLYRESSSAYANYAQRLASVYEHTRKPEDFMAAEAEFRSLFERGDYQANDVRTYGIIHHYMMNYSKDKALEVFDRLIENRADGDDEIYYRTKAQRQSLLSQIGRNDESIQEQREIVEAGASNPREYGLLIDAYCRSGDYPTAYEWFKKAAARFPGDWALYVYGGDICQALKLYDEAFRHWDKSLEINQQYMDAKFSKAFAYEELNDYVKAYETWCGIAEDLKAQGYEAEVQAVVEKAQRCKGLIKNPLR